MNLLQDIITYIRRIIKSPSDAVISDNLIIDYINRFWLMDVDARVQLFDLRTKYQFQTTPGIDQYNMPLYSIQTEPGAQTIASFPVYQGFMAPARVRGVNVPFYTTRSDFTNIWPNIVQNLGQITLGNGTAGPYTIQIPIGTGPQSNNIPPLNNNFLIPGHVDMTGVLKANTIVQDPIYGTTLNLKVPTTSVYSAVYFTATGANGQNIVAQDSGQFLSNNTDGDIYGLLMAPGQAPYGNFALPNGYFESDSITGITQATQAVITANNNFQPNQTVQINSVSGMTEINGMTVTVVLSSPTNFTISLNTTGFTPYIAGGTASSQTNVINYNTGIATNVFFPAAIPNNYPINVQCYFIQPGLPRAILYYNNIITLRAPPNTQYLVELDAYLTPAAFLNSGDAIPFGYMSEYIARGAARKILSDTGDTEQFMFYEPLFKEQETLVWKRSQRQFTSTRTQTIYSMGQNMNGNNGDFYNNSSGGF